MINSFQLPLAVQLPDDETFASFYPGQNAQLITMLKNAAIGEGVPLVYFWGWKGTGRSHLLHATCAEVNSSRHQTAVYIPLDRYEQYQPDILDGMERMPLLCLDNLDAIAGKRQWEEALFNLFNRWKDVSHGSLIMSANTVPRKLGLCLPDLASRLDWGVAYQLHELDDEGKLGALQLRAALRGFKLPVDAGRFLLNRLSRDMRTLLTALDKLDNASLHAQRKLTIPFIKEVMDL
jgi:DnaA family protein